MNEGIYDSRFKLPKRKQKETEATKRSNADVMAGILQLEAIRSGGAFVPKYFATLAFVSVVIFRCVMPLVTTKTRPS